MPKATPERAWARRRSGEPARVKPARCHTCGRSIRVPEGWVQGSAVRRHYWRYHRERMMGLDS